MEIQTSLFEEEVACEKKEEKEVKKPFEQFNSGKYKVKYIAEQEVIIDCSSLSDIKSRLPRHSKIIGMELMQAREYPRSNMHPALLARDDSWFNCYESTLFLDDLPNRIYDFAVSAMNDPMFIALKKIEYVLEALCDPYDGFSAHTAYEWVQESGDLYPPIRRELWYRTLRLLLLKATNYYGKRFDENNNLKKDFPALTEEQFNRLKESNKNVTSWLLNKTGLKFKRVEAFWDEYR